MADENALSKEITRRLGTVVEKLERIVGKFDELIKTVELGFKNVQKAIDENTQAQAELKLMEHMAEVTSIKPQIEAEHEQIEREMSELDEQLDRIGARFAEKHAELDERAEQRIRDLGEHIFRIDEQEFEAGIERPFAEHISSTWSDLLAHTERTGEARRSDLEAALDDARSAIDGFVADRESLLAEIDQHRTAVMPDVDTPQPIEVPFYVVGLERDGVYEEVVVPPAHLESSGDGWFAASVDPIEGFQTPTERVAATQADDAHPRKIADQAMYSTVDEYGREGVFGLVSYADAFDSATAENLMVQEEE